MRTIEADRIGETVYGLILKASYEIGEDVLCALQAAREKESSALGCSILDQILENDRIAGSEHIAICQDTGVCVIFMDIGQDVHIAGGDLSETLCSAVLGLAEDREELARMAQASAALGIRDAAAEICRHISLPE